MGTPNRMPRKVRVGFGAKLGTAQNSRVGPRERVASHKPQLYSTSLFVHQRSSSFIAPSPLFHCFTITVHPLDLQRKTTESPIP